jgi:hypothetical protein
VDFDDDLDNLIVSLAAILSQRRFANGRGFPSQIPGTRISYTALVAFEFRGDTYHCTWEAIWDVSADTSDLLVFPPNGNRGQYSHT